ncbi:hypothetical protein [Dokdonia sp.]|uniref:hypothetical protein n=1 Tax=Dokdonia sp. TaxID=2024995 RepID=UPI00326455F5
MKDIETGFIVYKLTPDKRLELVAEANTLELCENYLKQENFRVVPCHRKTKK